MVSDCCARFFKFLFLSFSGVAVLVNIGLMLSSIVLSYQQDLGDFNIEQYGIYAISALIEIFIFITCMIVFFGNNKGTKIILSLYILLGIVCAIQMLIPAATFSDNDKELFQAISFKNWRIDYQYVIFEKENQCEGLKAAGDQCGDLCCDDKYISALNGRLDLLKKMHISGFALQLICDILLVLGSLYAFSG